MAKSNNDTVSHDLFGRIAADRNVHSSAQLIEPKPTKHARRILESRICDPDAAFRPADKLNTLAKLQQELGRYRKRMALYERNLTPTLKRIRRIIPLVSFDYRLETAQDLANYSDALEGRGTWENVTIPHYGGPLGRATAYYRTTFKLEESQLGGKACWIRFKGVDYKAHVFVNGIFLGSHEGFFAPFEFDFTRVARQGTNVLLVRVENDAICMGNESWDQETEGDKIYAATGLGYDDPEVGWHHCPPGMGIYQEASVEVREKIHVADLFVRPLVEQKKAEVWVELESTLSTKIKAAIEFSIFGQNFKQTVVRDQRYEVPVGPTRNYYRYTVDIQSPRVWDLESPWLYRLQVKLLNEKGKLLDTAQQPFGMRSFTLDTHCVPKGMFHLNGRKIKLRGANEMGYLQQCVVKKQWNKLRDAILLAKIGNMNFIRLTQRPVQAEIYDACDKLGLMLQTDLPLFSVFRPNQFAEGVRQAGEMERLVRSHPSNILVTYINEPFPAGWTWLFNPYRHLSHADLDRFFMAADQAVRLANPDRVIKPVDGDYDPPHEGLPDNHCYNTWYIGSGLPLGKLIKGYWQKVKPGWNYACGEFGAEGLDPVETMYKYYPKAWLPKHREDAWSPKTIVKSQTERFHYAWFPTQTTIDRWVTQSQQYQAWAVRTMTEAFRRDPRMTSFAVHLFIDAFPAGWMKAIMDVDCHPKPAYFAYREALTPLSVNIQTDRNTYFSGQRLDMSFWICNDKNEEYKDFEIQYQVRQKGEIVFAAKAPAIIKALCPNYQGKFNYLLPNVSSRTDLSIEMALVDSKGTTLHDTRYPCAVFPVPMKKKSRVHVLGEKRGAAWRLMEELNLTPTVWTPSAGGIVVTDSFRLLMKNKPLLEKSIRQGASVILTDPIDRLDELEICNSKIEVREAGMGPRMFVDCQTRHPLVEGLFPNDFNMWYNSHTKLIDPIIALTMNTTEMEVILSTGDGTWLNPEWCTAEAATRKLFGSGKLIISLVMLNGRTAANPVALDYAQRLVLGFVPQV